MQFNHFPIDTLSTLSVNLLPSDSFLHEVNVFHVDDAGGISGAVGSPSEALAALAIQSGAAEISLDPESNAEGASATIAIPVHRAGRVVSVVSLAAKQISADHDETVGVFEVWEPVGVYEELALKSGFFGKMERFRNVSSFVRFEKGNGLPGQVWQERMAVIHDDLANHPGFLRAAGASADLLVTAIGLPVASRAFHGSALLISSRISPLARGFEVWQPSESGFSLLGGSYRGFGDGIELPSGATLSQGVGLPGLAAESGAAVLSRDIDTLFAGRNHDSQFPQSASGLAIPVFDGETLTSVATLLF